MPECKGYPLSHLRIASCIVMRLTLILDNNAILCSLLNKIVLVLNFYLAMSYSHWLSCFEWGMLGIVRNSQKVKRLYCVHCTALVRNTLNHFVPECKGYPLSLLEDRFWNTRTVMRLTLIWDNNVILCSVLKTIVFVLKFYLGMSYSHWLSCNFPSIFRIVWHSAFM